MRKALLILAVFLSCVFQLSAQSTRYIIKFRDKGSNIFTLQNPAAWLSQSAISRRAKYSIPLDSTDLPVSKAYIDSLRLSGNVSILNASKWLNQVTIRTTDAAALAKINSFPFVVRAIAAAPREANKFEDSLLASAPVQKEQNIQADVFNYGTNYAQIHMHNGEFLHNIGLQGQGMTIGMIDAGFFNYNTLIAFDSARLQNRILSTYDFVNLETSVAEDNAHGMQCFSVIAANVPGQMTGSAPKASFHLFRSEDAATEYIIEEHNWVCAAERLDSAGGSVISSSLGYNRFDDPATSHTYADMNGNITMAAIGADLAVKKGILVVNSAGNSGNDSWHYIVTPADGDSVLAVGAVNSAGIPAAFSSYGPSSDGQVKPDVTSLGAGAIVQYPNNSFGPSNGTSYSAPNIAGLATCLWQGFPEISNVRILQILRRSSSQYFNPDDRVGYGIPDVRMATMMLLDSLTTAQANVAGCITTLSFSSKDVKGMQYNIYRQLIGQTNWTKLATIPARGASFSKQAYGFEDPAGLSARYVIQQVLDTSLANYYAGSLDTITVVVPENCKYSSKPVLVFPNPATADASVKIHTTIGAKIELRVYNSIGQLMVRQTSTANTAIQYADLRSSIWARGMYRVMVIVNDQVLGTEPFQKL